MAGPPFCVDLALLGVPLVTQRLPDALCFLRRDAWAAAAGGWRALTLLARPFARLRLFGVAPLLRVAAGCRGPLVRAFPVADAAAPPAAGSARTNWGCRRRCEP
jgi:hypothetical protein